MSYPPPPPGGPQSPWAPRGPGDAGATSTWGQPAAPARNWGGPATATAPTWGQPAPAPRPGAGGWATPGPPPEGARPWAPSGWNGGGAPTGPSTQPPGLPAARGGGLPPHPPGYVHSAAPNGAPLAGAPVPPAPDRSGRVMAALVGGVVGAIVAALIASGLVLAADDSPDTEQATGDTTATTEAPGSGMGVGDSLDIHDLLDMVQPTVVSINVQLQGGAGAGSGFVYDAGEGLILTNAHVVDGAEEISVTFFDGSAQGAQLVGAFPENDLAMIRVANVEGLHAAELGSSDALQVGDDVVAIGNALGLGGEPTVTTGIVSAKNRSIQTDFSALTGLIQTDAAINHGNSGGPLLNAQGQVVGINSAGADDGQNVGFAIAIDDVRPLIEELQDGGGVTEDSAFLGVATVALTTGELPTQLLDQFGIQELDGLIVSEVTPGSGADEAGIELGDVIISIDSTIVNDNATLGEVIRAKQAGDRVTVVVETRGEARDAIVTLGRRGG